MTFWRLTEDELKPPPHPYPYLTSGSSTALQGVGVHPLVLVVGVDTETEGSRDLNSVRAQIMIASVDSKVRLWWSCREMECFCALQDFPCFYEEQGACAVMCMRRIVQLCGCNDCFLRRQRGASVVVFCDAFHFKGTILSREATPACADTTLMKCACCKFATCIACHI